MHVILNKQFNFTNKQFLVKWDCCYKTLYSKLSRRKCWVIIEVIWVGDLSLVSCKWWREMFPLKSPLCWKPWLSHSTCFCYNYWGFKKTKTLHKSWSSWFYDLHEHFYLILLNTLYDNEWIRWWINRATLICFFFYIWS